MINLFYNKEFKEKKEVVKIIIQCAWCKRKLGEKEPLDYTGISHGICDKCKQKMKEELKQLNSENKSGRWK